MSFYHNKNVTSIVFVLLCFFINQFHTIKISFYHLYFKMLSSCYFERVINTKTTRRALVGYIPRTPSIVLYSKNTSTPLVALSVCPQASDAQSVMYKRNDVNATSDFQVLFQRGGDFQFVVTNLTATSVNVNILYNSDPSRDKDNIQGVNTISEFRAYESYAICCNQQTRRSLVLEEEEENITTGSEELRVQGETAKARGVYFWVAVAPNVLTPDAASIYGQTEWRVAETIFIEPPTRVNVQIYTELSGVTREVPAESILTMDSMEPVTRSGTMDTYDGLPNTGCSYPSFLPPQTCRGMGSIASPSSTPFQHCAPDINGTMFGFIGSVTASPSEAALRRNMRTDYESCPVLTSLDQQGSQRLDGMAGPKTQSQRVVPMTKGGFRLFGSKSKKGQAAFELEEKSARCTYASDAPCETIEEKSARVTDTSEAQCETIVALSRVARLTEGRVVEEPSRTTGYEYNYDLVSPPCILGLSISSDLLFVDSHDALVEKCRQEAQTLVEKDDIEVLADLKIYAQDECAICLEEKPDIVLYTCGHKCLHVACRSTELRTCPLCRAVIRAQLIQA